MFPEKLESAVQQRLKALFVLRLDKQESMNVWRGKIWVHASIFAAWHIDS